MKPWKLIVLMVLIYVAGLGTGLVAAKIIVRNLLARAVSSPALVRERIERELIRKLDLDAEQRHQTSDILLAAHGKIRALRQTFQPQFTEILTNTQQEIRTILKPGQIARFDELIKEQSRWRLPEQ